MKLIKTGLFIAMLTFTHFIAAAQQKVKPPFRNGFLKRILGSGRKCENSTREYDSFL
jgi:hypothetical protein